MTPEQTQAFRSQLEQQRADLLARIRAQRGGALGRAEAAAAHMDRTDVDDSRVQAAIEREAEFAMDEHELAELALIDAALERIARGSYGQCIDCGVDIPAARLQAAPAAARCIACQEKYERSHGLAV